MKYSKTELVFLRFDRGEETLTLPTHMFINNSRLNYTQAVRSLALYVKPAINGLQKVKVH